MAFLASTSAAAPLRQPLVSPRDASERQLIDDALDGELSSLSTFRAALIASGVHDEQQLAGYEARLNRMAAQLRREAGHVRSSRDQASTVILVLHRELLTGAFDDDCGSLATTLDSGRYNCVTATILFAELARAIDLACTVLHALGHVRVRIDGAEPFELEPTCADCLRQGRLLAWQSSPRPLSPAALVGKLYYNQGVAALERRDYAEAIAAFDRSLLLDPIDVQSKQNLLAALNNGALALCEQRDFSAAQALLSSAARLDPKYPPLPTNDLHLHGRWAIALCEASQHAAAVELLNRVAERHPSDSLCSHGRAAVYRLWVEDLSRRGETHAALARAEEGLALFPSDAALRQLHARLRKNS